jgi:hypothetical protein
VQQASLLPALGPIAPPVLPTQASTAAKRYPIIDHPDAPQKDLRA